MNALLEVKHILGFLISLLFLLAVYGVFEARKLLKKTKEDLLHAEDLLLKAKKLREDSSKIRAGLNSRSDLGDKP